MIQLTESTAIYPEYSSLVLDSYVAEALDEIGQVDPIVWSMSDPRFRKARDEQSFPLEWESPSQELIVPVAKAMGADYTLVVWSNRFGPLVRPIATLYKGAGERKIWAYGDWERRMAPFFNGNTTPVRDPGEIKDIFNGGAQEFSAVEVGQDLDWDSTSRTIARTWAWQIKDGPLKKLPARPRQRLGPPDPGFTVSLDAGVELRPVTMAEIEELVQTRHTDLAIVQLRDLIDQFPFDEVPRRRLAELLLQVKLYQEAASEAKRAAKFCKDPAPMFELAAEAYLQLRQFDDARQSIEQARKYGSAGRETALLSGRIYLWTGQYEESTREFEAAIRQGPTPTTVFFLALADAAAGDADGCRNNLAALVDHDPKGIEDAYPEAMLLAADLLEKIGLRIREDVPLIRKSPGQPELIARTAAMRIRLEGLAAFMELIPVPEQFAQSHEARRLAHNLMLKAASEAFEFAQNGSEADATGSTMNLGEALRLLPKVREQFQLEQSGQSEDALR